MTNQIKTAYEFECNIDSDVQNENFHDEWGAAFVWYGDIGVEYNFCIESDYNCSAIYKTEMDDENCFMVTDYNSFIHYEIDFNNENWQKQLRIAMCEALEKLHNLDVVCITVYEDTVPGHEDGDDFLNIVVLRKTAEDYFNDMIDKTVTWGNIDKDHYDCFDDWFHDYICDDTMGFYEYAAQRDAILDIV